MKRILVIATGGTIACSEGENGLTPKYKIDDLLAYIPKVSELCTISGKMLMNIDSSNMNPEYWVQIGKQIEEDYDSYDGFVVTHGTDTMAYTSAGLSYILNNLDKPVIITGAQHSIEEFGTDARQNLYDAIRYALEGIPGVFVAFDGKIINGTRAMKVKTKSLDAFQSVNYPYIAKIKYGKVYHDEIVKDIFTNKSGKPFYVDKNICSKIFLLKLFPGIEPGIFDFIKENYKGLIIESYGIGGIPFENYNLTSKVQELVNANIPVVVTTQCIEEGIDFGVYEVGKKLLESNVIFSKDMNTEAIVAKLMWSIGKTDSLMEIKKMMETPKLGDCI